MWIQSLRLLLLFIYLFIFMERRDIAPGENGSKIHKLTLH